MSDDSKVTVSGGETMSDLTVSAHGKLTVLSGGEAFETTVQKGSVADYGELVSTTLTSGAKVRIYAGATTHHDMVDSGGHEIVYDGGVAKRGLVLSTGKVTVSSGGKAVGETISSGGFLYVDSGGQASASVVSSGGYLVASAGGKIYNTVVEQDGMISLSGGIAYDTVAYGFDDVFKGGVDSKAVVSSGGGEFVQAGGKALGTTIVAGGRQQIASGGTATGTVVMDGGRQDVGFFAFYAQQKGVASGTIVESGGSQFVSGGSVYATTISAGGTQLLGGAGQGFNTVLDGSATVQTGAVVSATQISSGGVQSIEGSGKAEATVVSSGGQEIVGLQGVDSGSMVGSGGSETVSSGGTAYNVTLGHGLLEIASGGAVSGSVMFKGGATLAIDAASAGTGPTLLTSAVLSGFAVGDAVDLAGLAYNPNETVTVATSGVLTISSGGAAFELKVAGAAKGETGFTLTADSGTGTLLTLTAATMAFLRPVGGGYESAAMPDVSALVQAPASAAALTSEAAAGGIVETLLKTVSGGGFGLPLVSQTIS